MEERRQLKRRSFSLYMSVLDESTGKVLGTISDISTGGFKLESKRPIPINLNIRLRIEHTNEISKKRQIVFTAKSIWCQPDRYDLNLYNNGFQIVDMTPSDYDIFVQMFNSYGSKVSEISRTNSDYSWN